MSVLSDYRKLRENPELMAWMVKIVISILGKDYVDRAVIETVKEFPKLYSRMGGLVIGATGYLRDILTF